MINLGPIYRKPYCPQNGCGMLNGAGPEVVIACECGGAYLKHKYKVCPYCYKCSSCKRIGKKFYKED